MAAVRREPADERAKPHATLRAQVLTIHVSHAGAWDEASLRSVA